MVKPFPNEIWLDIFKGLAKEGEYDTLERCRVVCRVFQLMVRGCLGGTRYFWDVEEVEHIKVDTSGGRLRRWGGPQVVKIIGGNSKDGRQSIPHLATFASRLAGRWLRVKELWIENAVWRTQDLDLDAILRDLAVSSITELYITNITLPSILTLGRLVCALPLLKLLSLHDVRFTQNPFDAGTLSRFHLLPHTQLETLRLSHGYVGRKLRPSFAELVDLMAAISNRRCPVAPASLAHASPWSTVRDLTLSYVTFPSVATFARLLCALPALESIHLGGSCAFVKHGFDLRSVPVPPGLPLQLADVQLTNGFSIYSDSCSVTDLVEFFIATGLGKNLRRINACLSPILRVANEVDVALNRLVKHSAQSLHHLFLDSSLPFRISDGADEWVHADRSAAPYFNVSENTRLKHLDLKVPIFNSLTDVIVCVRAMHGSNVRDEDSAHELRLRLPTLDARGILGIAVNDVGIGLDWDKSILGWKRRRIERVAVQDAMVPDNAGTSVDNDMHTNNATIGATPHAAEVVTYADGQRRSSSHLKDAQVLAASACDDEPVPQRATAGSGTSVVMFPPDDYVLWTMFGLRRVYVDVKADSEKATPMIVPIPVLDYAGYPFVVSAASAPTLIGWRPPSFSANWCSSIRPTLQLAWRSYAIPGTSVATLLRPWLSFVTDHPPSLVHGCDDTRQKTFVHINKPSGKAAAVSGTRTVHVSYETVAALPRALSKTSWSVASGVECYRETEEDMNWPTFRGLEDRTSFKEMNPHLATFASRLSGRWPGVSKLSITRAVWRTQDLDLDAVCRDVAVTSTTGLRLTNVTLPSILTLGRFVCALPHLRELALTDVRFTQHPCDAGTISCFRLLPHTQLDALYLNHGRDDIELRPSFVELVDLMAVVSNRRCADPPPDLPQASPWSAVRRLTLDNATFPSVTTFARLLSCAFVKRGFDLRSVPMHPGLPLHLYTDPDFTADLVEFFIATGLAKQLRRIQGLRLSFLRVASESDAALNRLVKHSAQSLRHLSLESFSFWRISSDMNVLFFTDHSLELDVDLGRLTDWLPQLDAVLSGPIFNDLTNVVVGVGTRGGLLCLPTLAARGILGGYTHSVFMNSVRFGLHWDKRIREWRHYGIKKVVAQDAVVPNAEASADDDKDTNNTTTGAPAREAEGAAYADDQRPSSSNLVDAQVSAASACDDEPVPHNATTGSGTSVDMFAPHDHGTSEGR
ncbi:predicted protein [Postia placenta Mad-698-R]|nr:predicted protein [Postia placenta Mad-698-R]